MRRFTFSLVAFVTFLLLIPAGAQARPGDPGNRGPQAQNQRHDRRDARHDRRENRRDARHDRRDDRRDARHDRRDDRRDARHDRRDDRRHAHNHRTVEVRRGNGWHRAQVLGRRGGRIHVRYGNAAPIWVSASYVRGYGHYATPHGQRVSVLWGGGWWDGVIIARSGRLVKVSYIGYGPQWDEWVDISRIR